MDSKQAMHAMRNAAMAHLIDFCAHLRKAPADKYTEKDIHRIANIFEEALAIVGASIMVDDGVLKVETQTVTTDKPSSIDEMLKALGIAQTATSGKPRIGFTPEEN